RVLAEPNREQAIELITRMYALADAPADADTIAALAIQFCDFTERVLPEQAAPEDASPTRLVAVLREHQADRRTVTQERFAKAVAAEFAARQSRL
ncbi:MAG: MerR family transcriptional regulator, partial [Rhodococcus qingshengii]